MFIALRRTAPLNTRITPSLLADWKTQVAPSTTVKRKYFLVDTAALDALPVCPPDLDKWIIPRDTLELPADIYTEGMLVIDDGYDRAKLNVPNVLHIECAAKWSQERPGRSSGPNDSRPLLPDAGPQGPLPLCLGSTDPVPLPVVPAAPASLQLPPTEPRIETVLIAAARRIQ